MNRIGLFFVFIVTFTHLCSQTATAPSAGDGTIGNPYQIATLENLYWIAANTSNWDNHYIQTANIDAEDTHSWFIGDHDSTAATPDVPMGWKPMNFLNDFDGNNFTISNLFINRPLEDNVGFIGFTYSSFITNIRLVNVDITGCKNVGGIAGVLEAGSISYSSVTGRITGNFRVGGIIGIFLGSVTNCYSDVDVVTRTHVAGGIIGFTYVECSLTDTYSSGSVTATRDGAGGLVGEMYGCYDSSVNDSHSTCTVTGNDYVGGLFGRVFDGDFFINNCYASGDVTGNNDVGGFVGELYLGVIEASFSSGSVNAENYVGGFAGRVLDCRIEASFSSGSVNAENIVGGLVGYIYGNYDNDYVILNSYSTGSVKGLNNVGGLVGFDDTLSYILNSYSTGSVTGESNLGGFIGFGFDYGTYEGNNFWDIESSGTINGVGNIESESSVVTGITTAEMKTLSTFINAFWDFKGETANGTEDFWSIDGFYNDGLPFLTWQGYPSSTPQNIIITYSSNTAVLSWDAVDEAVSYKIYTSTNPFAPFPFEWTLANSGIPCPEWVDTNVSEFRKFYVIIAVK